MSFRKSPNIITCVLLLCLLLSIQGFAMLQNHKTSQRKTKAKKEQLRSANTLQNRILDTSKTAIFRDTTIQFGKDSVGSKMANGDTLGRDSLRDSAQISTLKVPVFSTAKDSIVEDFTEGKRMIYYYGDVTVKYEDISISAAYMAYNVQSKTVFAKGLPDSTGVIQGRPVMKEGNGQYEMDNVYYNFNSKKAKIRNMVTQEGEGYVHGDFLKKMPDNSINISKGKYTTCDADPPHFYLQMTAAKVINNGPVKKTVFGPAYVVIEDVPTIFALPFGFVPRISKRSGGILIPTYGEESARGFYLRGLGYYFVFGEHLDLAATCDIYTRGSWAINANMRYSKRYKYAGTFSGVYSVDKTGDKGSPDYFSTTNFSMNWSHAQDSKARPGTTFRASVNFSSPSNSRYNSTTIQKALTNQISSSISYTKTWAGTPFSLSVNALHSQNSRDSSYAVTLPNFTFTVARIYPFRRKVQVGKQKFYETITFNYTANFDNKINFKSSQIHDSDFFKKMKNGLQNSFSIGLPTFTLFKYIQGSPGVSYGMNMFFSDSKQSFDQATQKIVTEYSNPFSTLGITQSYSFSLGLSTRLYGLFQFGKNHALQAIRHMITPTLSFSYQPELGTAANGYKTLNYVDKSGVQHSVVYNRYSGQIYSPPGQGKSAGMTFSIGNNIEAKIRSKADTSGTGTKKVKLIDQLNISGSYNFLADSLRLSNISVSATTTIFGKMALSGNISLDPYAINSHGVRINKLNIVQEGGFKLFRLTNASFSTSYSFSGEGKSKLGANYHPESGIAGSVTSSDGAYQRIYYHPVTGEYIPGGWVYYYDPSLPWAINLSYSYSYSKSYQYSNEQLMVENNNTMTLGISSQIKLYKDLNISLNTGFDLTKMKMTTTQLSGSFSLHCFQISISWIPNGKWESWSFRIAANASSLADLLQYKKNASYWDK